jgi:hypothetical protein
MRQRIRFHLTFASVVSLAALFVALGGTATAVTYVVSSNSQIGPGTVSGHKPPSGKHPNIIGGSVNAFDVANNSLGGFKIKESTLDKVPNAANLDGKPASDYRLHCPGNLDRAGDLCYEVDLRDSDSYRAALKKCALDQRRLPTDGELAQAFDHLSALQPQQWVAGHFRVSNGGQNLATTLGNGTNRDLTFDVLDANSAIPFRCVTSATN